jgi:hypothetical protein
MVKRISSSFSSPMTQAAKFDNIGWAAMKAVRLDRWLSG